MRFADYKAKSIQEAVRTAPQAKIDLSHLDDSHMNPLRGIALQRAQSFQEQQ